MRHPYRLGIFLALGVVLLGTCRAHAQDTRILGFADVTSAFNPKTGKVSFGLGEQDLFITSDISDRISFLGETVFKYDATAATKFAVSVERIIAKYNYAGNHTFLAGKVHTPVNYWNDTYHHGRVFFPTIFRPAIFNEGLLPIHTLGVGLQGQNLTDWKFGYDVMVGNGLGAYDGSDNDLRKSVTVAAYFKPVEGMRFGVSSYTDRISAGATGHAHGSPTTGPLPHAVQQQMFTTSLALFKPKYELLAESSYITNSGKADSVGFKAQTVASYVYVGLRLLPKLVLYGRFDDIRHQNAKEEMFFTTDALNSYVGGLRYEFTYLAVAKLEYQHDERKPMEGARLITNAITAQVAVGF